MTCTAYLQRWKLLTFFILFASCVPSYVECSYSVRDDEGCQETSCATCSRSPTCSVNHSLRGGVARGYSEMQVRGRLPRPATWLLVALLSALTGAAACWLANLLAPPPDYGGKTSMQCLLADSADSAEGATVAEDPLVRRAAARSHVTTSS